MAQIVQQQSTASVVFHPLSPCWVHDVKQTFQGHHEKNSTSCYDLMKLADNLQDGQRKEPEKKTVN